MWCHLIPFDFTWSHVVSFDFTWFKFSSPDFTWLHLISLDSTWVHLTSLDFIWFHLISLDVTLFHLTSLELTRNQWTHWTSLEISVLSKGKREDACTNETKRNDFPVWLTPKSPIYIYIYIYNFLVLIIDGLVSSPTSPSVDATGVSLGTLIAQSRIDSGHGDVYNWSLYTDISLFIYSHPLHVAPILVAV